jgi:ABC-type Fe3+-hydroxamate transport system substrate-binding protein
MVMLNAYNLLVGRTSGDTKPDLIRNIPIVANPRPDIERIVKIQPDIVIVDANLINPADLERLKGHDFDVEAFKVNTLEDWKEAVWRLGSIVNQYTEASARVDALDQSIQTAAQSPMNPKPRVVVAMGGAKPWVAGLGSFQADVIRKAGGEPVGPPGEKFVAVNPEQIVAWNPEFAFVSDPVAGYSGAAWTATGAFAKHQIFEVQPDLLLRPGSDVAKLLDGLSRSLRNPGGA